jgi:transcriptional regulator
MDIQTDIKPRDMAIMALRDQGIANAEIANIVGVTPTYPSKIARKLQTKWSIIDKTTLSLAYRANKMILQAAVEPSKLKNPLPFPVKGTDVNACIDRVVDRAQPIKRDADQQQAAPIAPVSINILFQGPVSQPVIEQNQAKPQFNISNSFPQSANEP